MGVNKKHIRTLREYYVVKANDLIRKGRYNLTTQQQKIVLFAISKIKKNDSPNKWYAISLEELCAACDLNIDAGGTYITRIKQDLLKLTERVWVESEDKSEWTVSWLADAELTPPPGVDIPDEPGRIVSLQFHKKMWPYLFDLSKQYTQYHLYEVLVYKNKYAIRLYEILRSYYTQEELDNGIEKEVQFTPDQLRDLFCATAYKEWKEFNRNVLQKAVAEINQFSEQMKVEYKTIKNGRNVCVIIFNITAPDYSERTSRYRNQKKRLPE